jgi:hypothetical protein
VIDTCSPSLNNNGLAVVQTLKAIDNKNTLVTLLCHESGETLESNIYLPDINDPQKLTAAITYLRRSSYLAIVGLVADEDDDGNSVSTQPQQKLDVAGSVKIDFNIFVRLYDFCSSIKLDISKYEEKVFEHIIEDDQNLAELEKNNPHLLIIFKNEIDKKYPELSKILDQKLELIKLNSASRNITDILKSCESENSISRNNQIFLDNQSIDDYCEWLRNGHADLLLMVNFYLRFKTETGSKNLEAAIKRLAEESQSGLNAVRAEYLYGITSQNSPTSDNTLEVEPQYDVIPLEYDPEHNVLDWVKEQDS